VQDVKLKVAEQPADVLAAATGHGEESGEQSGGAQASSAASNFGLQLQTLNADLAQRLRMQNAPDAGAVVTRVDPRSIAARAGIRPGDVITEINGQKITSAADASGALDKADLSKGVRFYVTSRDGMSRLVFLKQGPG
jgi:serine protease Do